MSLFVLFYFPFFPLSRSFISLITGPPLTCFFYYLFLLSYPYPLYITYFISKAKENDLSRAYLNFVNIPALLEFYKAYDGHVFIDSKGKVILILYCIKVLNSTSGENFYHIDIYSYTFAFMNLIFLVIIYRCGK